MLRSIQPAFRPIQPALRPIQRTITSAMSTNRSHATDPQTQSAVPEGVQRNVPKGVEEALPDSVSETPLWPRPPLMAGAQHQPHRQRPQVACHWPFSRPRGYPKGRPGGFGKGPPRVDPPDQPEVGNELQSLEVVV